MNICWYSDEELEIHPCLEIQDIFVCSPEYKKKRTLSWTELSKEPLILLEKNSVSRQYTDEKFEGKNIKLDPQIEVAVHDLLLRFASINLGISCVIEEFSKESIESKKVEKINLLPPLPKRYIGYAHLINSPLSPAAREFIKLIKKDNN